NIVKARLYPLKNAMIIDKIYVSNWHHVKWDGFEDTFITELTEKILSECEKIYKVSDLLQGDGHLSNRSMPQRYFINFEPFVELDNDISESNTMIELFAGDRVGLLYDISRMFVAYDIDIVSAIINTEGNIAHDVFYVQHEGEKISNLRALEVSRSIYHVIGAGLNGR
ncbi:MAG: hypothetical protein SNJ53_02420, partial [Thermodesulfovibrionales bacterium]